MIFVLARTKHEAARAAREQGLETRHWANLSNEWMLHGQSAPTILMLSCTGRPEGFMLEAIRACDAAVIHIHCGRH